MAVVHSMFSHSGCENVGLIRAVNWEVVEAVSVKILVVVDCLVVIHRVAWGHDGVGLMPIASDLVTIKVNSVWDWPP